MEKREAVKKSLALVLSLSVGASAAYVPADPMRFTVWNPGLMSVGGIPNRTGVCATLSPSGGEDSDDIQNAIDACPAGQVVQLTAGTFNVDDLILIHKAVTLRGAGMGQTILRKTNGASPNSDTFAEAEPMVILGPSRWPHPDDSTSRNLASDSPKGSMSVVVSSGAGFAPGQFVLLDELSGASWQPDRAPRTPGSQVWASPDYRTVWTAHKPAWTWEDDFNPDGPEDQKDALGWFCRWDRPISEIKEVASVSGNTVTFTTPLHIDYRASRTAQLTRFTSAFGGSVHATYAGLEALTAVGGSDGTVRFECAAYSWARDVEITVWKGEGFAFDNSFKCELRRVYVHDAANAVPGGGAYAISLASGTSEILVEDSIAVRANKNMVARCSGAGSVFGYNYTDQSFIAYAEDWIEAGLNASHMIGPHHVLFEGNYGVSFDSDYTHGNSTYMTVFRNWLRGVRRPFVNPATGHIVDDEAPGSPAGPKRCISNSAYAIGFTFVGNVLGAQGKMGGWSYDGSGPGGFDNAPAIWLLGWEHSEYDPEAKNTALRDGNWDWLRGLQSWHTSPAVSLQDSLYLPGKPAFFGANPWPWVDPSTGETFTLPAKARYEALAQGDTLSPARPRGFRKR